MSALAYHSNPKLKKLLVDELEIHRAQDQLVKGTYQKGLKDKFRGCSIGCAIHSLNTRLGKTMPPSSHEELSNETGIPVILLYINDHLFERLDDEQSQTWPVRFFDAIPCGADLSHVHGKFFAWSFLDDQVGLWKVWKSEEDQQIFKDYGNFVAYLATDQPFNKKAWDAVRQPFLKSLGSLARLASLGSLASLARLASLDRLDRLDSLGSLDRLDSLARLASPDRLDSLASLARLDRLDRLGIYKIAAEKILQLLREAPIPQTETV